MILKPTVIKLYPVGGQNLFSFDEYVSYKVHFLLWAVVGGCVWVLVHAPKDGINISINYDRKRQFWLKNIVSGCVANCTRVSDVYASITIYVIVS